MAGPYTFGGLAREALASAPAPSPAPAPAPAISLAAVGNATEGAPFAVTLTAANLTGQLVCTPARTSGPAATFAPTTVAPAPGDLQKVFTVTPASAGALQIRATANGGAVVSNLLTITVQAAAAPPPPAPPPPAPPPAPSGSVAVSLTSATSGTLPFVFGQAFRQGHIPVNQGVAVGGATAQATVKNRWPDGSVRFAIIAGTYVSPGNSVQATLSAGTASTGTALTTADLKATGIAAVVDAGAFGSATWGANSTDWDAPFEVWVSGHRMSSWIYRKAIGSDAHLVAWLEVRLFAGGAVEVLPWVENGYLTVASPSNRSATYTFTLGGTQRFSAAIDLPHHCRTPLVTGAAVSHWLGTAPGVAVMPDTEYLQSTEMVPAYFARTPANAAAVAALPTSWTPLARASFPSALGSVGGNDYVGLLPGWDVLALTCPTAATIKAVEFNAFAAGRYPIYYREDPTFATTADRFRWPRLANRPTFDAQSLPAATGTAPPSWTGDHQPTVGLLAYLLTGRRYHLDTMQAASAVDTFFGISTTNRQQGQGLRPTQFAGAARGAAWALRNLGLVLALAPDAQAEADYRAQMTNNVTYYWARYVGAGGPSNPRGNRFGFVQPYSSYSANLNGQVGAGATTTSIPVQGTSISYGNAGNGQFVGATLYSFGLSQSRVVTGFNAATNTFTVDPPFPSVPALNSVVAVDDGKWWDAPWLQDYVTAAFGWLASLALGLDATATTRLGEFVRWKAQSIVGRLGLSDASSFFYRDFSPYTMAVAPFPWPNDTAWDNGTGPWFGSWGDIYAATYGGTAPLDNAPPWPYASNGPKVDGPLRNDGIGDVTGSVMAALPAIAYAMKHNVPGARVAYSLLTQAQNWPDIVAALDAQPVWAVAPGPMPRWAHGAAVGQWVEVPGTSLYSKNGSAPFVPSSVARQTDGTASAGSPWLDGYSGFGVDQATGTLWQLANGGHGDYYGNEVVRLDAMADAPRWAEWFKGSNGNVVQSGAYAAANYPQGIFDPQRARYLDDGVVGRLPASAHTYWATWGIERMRVVFRGPGTSYAPAGTGFADVELFNSDSPQGVNGWAAQYTIPGGFVSGYTGTVQGPTPMIRPGTTYDPRTGCVYVVAGPTGTRKMTPSATGVGGTWSALPAGNDQQAACAVDTKRGRLFMVNGGNGVAAAPASYLTIDAASPAWVTVTLTGTPAASIAASPATDGWGLTYVPAIDAYLLKRGTTDGSEVFRIDAATFAVTLYTTSGTPAPASQFIAANNANVYNRWQYVHRLRGLVYAPRNAENLWFLRLH